MGGSPGFSDATLGPDSFYRLSMLLGPGHGHFNNWLEIVADQLDLQGGLRLEIFEETRVSYLERFDIEALSPREFEHKMESSYAIHPFDTRNGDFGPIRPTSSGRCLDDDPTLVRLLYCKAVA